MSTLAVLCRKKKQNTPMKALMFLLYSSNGHMIWLLQVWKGWNCSLQTTVVSFLNHENGKFLICCRQKKTLDKTVSHICFLICSFRLYYSFLYQSTSYERQWDFKRQTSPNNGVKKGILQDCSEIVGFCFIKKNKHLTHYQTLKYSISKLNKTQSSNKFHICV